MNSSLLIQIGIAVLLAWGFYIIFLTGQFSLGNSAFMAVGAYVSGIASVKFGLPIVVALLIGAAAGMIFGLVIGGIALRIRGVYLAMATLGAAIIVQSIIGSIGYVGGNTGFSGMSGTTVPLVYACVAVVFVCVLALRRARIGLAIRALRQDEEMAGALGFNVTYLKILAFVTGAGITALAGGLDSHFLFYISPDQFDLNQSVSPIYAIALGGFSLIGPAIGAAVTVLLPQYLRFLGDNRTLAYGGLVIVVLAARAALSGRVALRHYLAQFIPRRPAGSRSRDLRPATGRSAYQNEGVSGE